MNQLTFRCSEHGVQPVKVIATGKLVPVPVRIQLLCGCVWAWRDTDTWEQMTATNGFQLIASDFFEKGQPA